ncbi:pilus assembly protein PilV [Salmonella enterica]|uniref:Pilus assembly protein PilV n=18 Tax=Enterobacteriaceae TaxID=543 RepID=A0A7A6TNW4_ECOLX|nr:pilus assembly protein PilV [Shigella sonnei]EAA9312455.1 pilus assembly protein PilV [Salmonella enterica]EBS4977282.1 pilus assembly protein PilV [Salmonella enterica subsp. enterica serovar Enteritidis]ECK1547971.1 pilus assembly protein PilV [Salmonella enterica subsp. enterica serovar Kentucky]ECS8810649.1 pilus assembly protein PilV [Salmonella enterica subsp. enterica serovar Derby]EDE7434349.1 pilus assembly protein PilV [Salmonella enterica subsp. enterica serovar Typhimurium]EDQ0
MSTDWQKTLLAAVFADHLLYDQLSPYYQNCFYAKYRIGTGLRANPVPGNHHQRRYGRI